MFEDLFPAKDLISGIVVDTNLLLLLLVGNYDLNKIESTKRINKYTIEDYYKIVNLIDYYATDITITPNILTEVCNLSDKFNEESNYRFFEWMEEFLNTQVEHIEYSMKTIENNKKCYLKLGISDATILNLAKSNKLVLTDDLDLYHFLISQSFHAINYNHLIQMEISK